MEWQFSCARISLARECNGLSQSELGKLIGATQSQISQWENGDIVPGQIILMKICNALGTPPEFFFVRSVNPVNDENKAA